jgi:hypothetical protein
MQLEQSHFIGCKRFLSERCILISRLFLQDKCGITSSINLQGYSKTYAVICRASAMPLTSIGHLQGISIWLALGG